MSRLAASRSSRPTIPTGSTSELLQLPTNSTCEAKSECRPSDRTTVENKETEHAHPTTNNQLERSSDTVWNNWKTPASLDSSSTNQTRGPSSPLERLLPRREPLTWIESRLKSSRSKRRLSRSDPAIYSLTFIKSSSSHSLLLHCSCWFPLIIYLRWSPNLFIYYYYYFHNLYGL